MVHIANGYTKRTQVSNAKKIIAKYMEQNHIAARLTRRTAIEL